MLSSYHTDDGVSDLLLNLNDSVIKLAAVWYLLLGVERVNHVLKVGALPHTQWLLCHDHPLDKRV